ncbi:21 kDa protein [Ricinus communis]|uniref:21 kDa protein, putative n=1 Tax=Ricinus communis TaxID=3988 RepID=B9RBQ1_RICCO|nr:21 kDa protein [Ricinus communis]EEF50972.1 21 kDa protein precursor, putative [Ricinus communis]|eukprot:XP_002509585.1 21 kDa protein [Ricinus communis]
MAKLVLCLLVLSIAGKAGSASSPIDFIKASCKATRYPDLCVQCLSGYASAIQQNEQHLAQTALSVSLTRAKSAGDYVKKLTKVRGIKAREYRAVKDCIDNMGDTVDRLSQSIRELDHMGRAVGKDFVWHMSNVQTWVSAALTDENTCLDGFAGRHMDGNVKAAIKSRVTNVARVTSNALALVNRFASRHRKAASGETP